MLDQDRSIVHCLSRDVLVSDVASNHSQWLVSPLQVRQCFEAMAIHHEQLKAFYGIIHLASKVIDLTDVSQTLFVDVIGENSRPDLEPSQWRKAVKVEPLFGRMFGFHYKADMRNFLRMVCIARGSIATAATTAPRVSSPLVRNLTALGWGWIYSNMVLLNNMGLPVDGAAHIAADLDKNSTGLEQVRTYMNLAEDPIFASMTSLGSADVEVDFVFQIVTNDDDQNAVHFAPLSRTSQSSLEIPMRAIPVRLVSHTARPIDDKLRRNIRLRNVQSKAPSKSPAGASVRGNEQDAPEFSPLPVTHDLVEENTVTELNAKHLPDSDSCGSARLLGVPRLTMDEIQRGEPYSTGGPSATPSAELAEVACPNGDDFMTSTDRDCIGQHGLESKSRNSAFSPATNEENAPVTTAMLRDSDRATTTGIHSVSSSPLERCERRRSIPEALLQAAEGSMLANAIKTEFVKFQSNMVQLLSRKPNEPASGLIIHFHGGGFISQSSSGHLVYLKEWAADMPDAVILSVDYRLAPEFPYPCALLDCLFAYQWAVCNANKIGSSADRVVLCGDSAGGNLAVAVALKAIELGLRRPDGVFLAYPALYLNVAWSPSRVLSFFDPLLPCSVLDLCLRSYVPANEKPYEDPFISPLVAGPEALRELPPVTLLTGSLDPLLDDSVQFVHKLRACGRGCDTLEILQNMPHGFLSMIQVSKEARDALRFLSNAMSQCLEVALQKSVVTVEEEQTGETHVAATSTAIFDT